MWKRRWDKGRDIVFLITVSWFSMFCWSIVGFLAWVYTLHTVSLAYQSCFVRRLRLKNEDIVSFFGRYAVGLADIGVPVSLESEAVCRGCCFGQTLHCLGRLPTRTKLQSLGHEREGIGTPHSLRSCLNDHGNPGR
ncbi:hypothetical protein VTI74DRAFT_6397 [Chaetomium olivicolor]